MSPAIERRSGLTELEQEAKAILQPFIKSSYRAIVALRSLTQARLGHFDLDDEQFDYVRRVVQEESNGRLYFTAGRLCQITKNGAVSWSHDKDDFPNRSWFGRGFYFGVTLEEKRFACVILDHGLSRKNFDEENTVERRKIIRRFGKRVLSNPIMALQDIHVYSSPGFAVFMTDDGEKLEIQECVVC